MDRLSDGMERCGGASIAGDVARNPDGSIDYGFYRRGASKLRRTTLRRAFQRAKRLMRPMVALAIIAVAIRVMPTAAPQAMPQGADVAKAGLAMSASTVN